jgi:hypothetical protein
LSFLTVRLRVSLDAQAFLLLGYVQNCAGIVQCSNKKKIDRGGSRGNECESYGSAVEEQFYTVAEAAKFLKVSRDTITRLFADEPGVVDLGSPERLHKRRYRVLRIPHAVFNRVIHKLRVQ